MGDVRLHRSFPFHVKWSTSLPCPSEPEEEFYSWDAPPFPGSAETQLFLPLLFLLTPPLPSGAFY